MKKILIIAPTFLPGYKGGGPVQSVKNIIENLNDEFKFYVLTLDRDKGDNKPYSSIKTETWLEKDNYQIYYSSNKSMKKIRTCIKETQPDIIYLNSFFSWTDSIQIVLLNKLFLIKSKIIIAPRGEFDEGAIKIKKIKKKLYINAFNILGLGKYISWHATSENEKANIINQIPKADDIKVANNLTSNYDKMELKYREKVKGKLKLIFISRITEKKNLLMALSILKEVSVGDVQFEIYGPIEDEDYWKKCKELVSQMPSNIKVSYLGEITHDKIINVLNQAHFFLFPTFGENYGHVISESLISGCPVIISKETPWLELQNENVGWDIDLNDKEKFISVINECVNMNQKEYSLLSESSFNYAKKKSNLKENKKKTEQLFL